MGPTAKITQKARIKYFILYHNGKNAEPCNENSVRCNLTIRLKQTIKGFAHGMVRFLSIIWVPGEFPWVLNVPRQEKPTCG
jgi:hypothetical protein